MRARILIDSELALWALAAPARLSREVRELLDAAEVYVSAASILEIGLKSGAAAGARAAQVLAALEPTGFRTLAVTAEHAALAAGFATSATDPVDRLLLAQASAEGMTLVTTDAPLAAAAAPGRAPGRGGRSRAASASRGPRRAQAIGPSRRPRSAPAVRCAVILAAARPPKRRARG